MLHFSHLIFSANQMAGLWNATLDWNELIEILITPAKVCYLPLSILNILIHHRSGVYFYAIITEKKYTIISNICEHQLKILPCFCRNTRRVPRQLPSTTKYRSCIRTRKNNQGVPFISIFKNIQQTTYSKSLIKAVIQCLNFTLLTKWRRYNVLNEIVIVSSYWIRISPVYHFNVYLAKLEKAFVFQRAIGLDWKQEWIKEVTRLKLTNSKSIIETHEKSVKYNNKNTRTTSRTSLLTQKGYYMFRFMGQNIRFIFWVRIKRQAPF